MNWSRPKYDFKGAAVLVAGGMSGIGGADAGLRPSEANVTDIMTLAFTKDCDSRLSSYRHLHFGIEADASIDAAVEAMPTYDKLINSAGM